MHTESLSAFMLLRCQLSSTVKDLAKLYGEPHVLEIKFIKSVRSPACSLRWLFGLKFVKLAVDFKCPVRYVSALILAFQQSGFLSNGKYSKLMVVILWYFDPFLLPKAKSFQHFNSCFFTQKIDLP